MTTFYTYTEQTRDMGFVVLAMPGGDTLRTLLGVLGSIAAGLLTVTNLFGGAKTMNTLADDGQ